MIIRANSVKDAKQEFIEIKRIDFGAFYRVKVRVLKKSAKDYKGIYEVLYK